MKTLILNGSPRKSRLKERKNKDEGWQVAKDAWFFERYNCPRFTTPDENGKVVLDYCVYLRGGNNIFIK